MSDEEKKEPLPRKRFSADELKSVEPFKSMYSAWQKNSKSADSKAPARVGRVAPYERNLQKSGYIDSLININPPPPDPLIEQFKQEINEGILPQALIERDRLVDPDHPVSAAFQKKMTAITQRLLGDRYDAALHDFRFVVQDYDGPNAGVICEGKRPLVSFSTNLIGQLQTEDDLAAALAHELLHKQMFERIGKHKVGNPEEAGADMWAVRALQKAGYNPRAMRRVLELLPDDKPARRYSIINTIIKIPDPHPPLATRKRNVEAKQAYLELRQELNEDYTPLDAAFRSSVAGLRHVSYVQKKLADAHYDAMPTEQKIETLRRLIDDEFLNVHPLHSVRRDDLAAAIVALKPQAQAHAAALHDLVRHIVNSETPEKGVYENAEIYYNAIAEAIGAEYYNIPLGRLNDLSVAREDFVKAETREEALAAAGTINAVAKEYKFGHSKKLDSLHWPQFQIPDRAAIQQAQDTGQPLELPWWKHLGWASDGGPGGAEIESALFHYNLGDPAITRRMPADFVPIAPDMPDWRAAKWSLSEVQIGAQGQLAFAVKDQKRRFKSNNSFALRTSELQMLAAIDQQQKEIAQKTDWTELEKDFWGFIAKHREELTPQVTVVDGGWAFAEAFMQHAQVLRQREPEKYGPLLHELFTGKNPANSQKHGEFSSFSPPPDSIPGLVQAFSSKHNVSAGYSTDLNLPEGPVDHWREHQSDRVTFGIGMKHPYVQFMLDQAGDLFDTDDKLDLLANTRCRNGRAGRPDDFLAFDPGKLFNYEKPQSAEQLIDVLAHLSGFPDYNAEYGKKKSLIHDICKLEIYGWLVQQKPERLDLAKIAAQNPEDIALPRDGFNMTREQIKSHASRFNECLEKQVEHNALHELKEGALPAGQLVAAYQFYDRHEQGVSLFTRTPKLREQYEQAIMRAVDALPGPQERHAQAERLLFKSELRNADFRKWAIDTWVETQTTLLGKDTTKADYKTRLDYQERFLGIAKTVIKEAQMGQAPMLITALLERVQAQETLSIAVRDLLYDTYLRKGGEVHLLASGNDYLLEELGNKPGMRQAMLDFITSPLDDKACRDMLYAVYSDDSSGKDLQRFLKASHDYRGLPITDEVKKHALAQIHKNFWSLPFEARSFYIERVLFPVEGTTPAVFRQAVNFTLDKILPMDKPYAPEARKILLTHLEQCSVELQRLVFSALISASERLPGQTEDLRPGRILAMVLGRHGAAGAKILQAVHSYLSSIDTENDPALAQFRDDIKSSKTSHAMPFRWEIFERMAQVVEPEKTAGVTHVGECLGGGSYGYAVRLERGREESALTLLRPEAEEKETKYQFGRFTVTAKKLAAEDKRWEPLVGILQHARDMTDVECDFNVGAVQIGLAEKLYNGIKVDVGDMSYSINTAGLLAHGEKYKETTLARGVHFNDLPEKSPQDLLYKKATAKALFTAELYLILRGGPFDHDRMGGQQRIVRLSPTQSAITMFDHGAMALVEPTGEEKQALGRVLLDSYHDVQTKRVRFADALLQRLTDSGQYGEASGYLGTLKRGLLALGDYRRYMTDDELQQSIFSIMKTGAVDQTVIGTIITGLDPAVMGELQHKSMQSDIALHDPKIAMGVKVSAPALPLPKEVSTKMRKLFTWGKPADAQAASGITGEGGDISGTNLAARFAPKGGYGAAMPRKAYSNPDGFKNAGPGVRGGGG